MRKIYGCHFFVATAFLLFSFSIVNAQAVLNADGPGNTYEIINSVLAPGYNVVENPECIHPAFGRHITELFDAELNKFVFEFYSHVTPDNDRCINIDRQRIEIKTYDQSPDSLLGVVGETVTYKWRFKIPAGFQPSSSFTHLHQVKAVGGDDDDPIFTLTARKGTPNKMELIYVPTSVSPSQKLRIVNLSLFEGTWVEVIERIVVGSIGEYSINVNRVSDGFSIISYSNGNIATIRSDNSFIRPKWGIYRSLNTPADLRDETIRFSDISIGEGNVLLPVDLLFFNGTVKSAGNILTWQTASENNASYFEVERSVDGILFTGIGRIAASGNSSQLRTYHFTDKWPVTGNNYYRLRLTDRDARFTNSETILIKWEGRGASTLELYPNPVSNFLQLNLKPLPAIAMLNITNGGGKTIFSSKGSVPQLTNDINQQVSHWSAGIYYVKIYSVATFYTARFIKQ